MNKLFALCITAAAMSVAFAQESETYVKPSPASEKYRAYRHQNSEPTFGLSKVKALIKGLKEDENGSQIMADKKFNALSVPERFTYVMIHGEIFAQNCDAMPGIVDEEKKIFGYIPSPFYYTETYWSDKQSAFLKKNRTAVLKLIQTTINRNPRVGANLKNAIMEVNGYELIPTLATAYKRDHKDHDILTLMMLLMKENKYKPFVDSLSYKKLYGKDTDYRSFINANAANQKLVVERAMAFYQTRKK